MRRLLSCRGHLPSFMLGMAGPSIPPERLLRGLLQAFYTVPEQYQQSLGDRGAHCRLLRTVPAFWTLDRTTITGRSAVILRQHTTPFRPMIVPLMIWSLPSKLEKSEPSHTRKFPRVNA